MANARLHLLLLSQEADIVFALMEVEKDIDANDAPKLSTPELFVRLEKKADMPLSYSEISQRCKHLAQHGLVVSIAGRRGTNFLRLAPHVRSALLALDGAEAVK